MRTNIAQRIAGRRLAKLSPNPQGASRAAKADAEAANKMWTHFHTQVQLLASEATHKIGELLKAVDRAHNLHKQVGQGTPGLMDLDSVRIINAHHAVEDALAQLGKLRALSSFETTVSQLHGPVLRADQEAYGVKI